MLHRFKRKDFYFNVDSTVSRLHTNIVGIKSELRNFITYKGMKLVSIDISNSQPFLSIALLDSRFYIEPKIHGKLNINSIIKSPHKYKQLLSKSTINEIASIIMLVRSHTSYDGKGFQHYIDEVVNGSLYDYIYNQLKSTNEAVILTRKQLKEIIFRVLYTDNRFIGQRAAEPKRLFKKIFPDVYQVFNLIKRGDKTALARLLQTIESKLMLEVIAKRISLEKPDMPLYTIHDSVVCPVGFEDYCAKVIEEEMSKAIGYSPKFKFEYWSPENVNK